MLPHSSTSGTHLYVFIVEIRDALATLWFWLEKLRVVMLICPEIPHFAPGLLFQGLDIVFDRAVQQHVCDVRFSMLSSLLCHFARNVGNHHVAST